MPASYGLRLVLQADLVSQELAVPKDSYAAIHWPTLVAKQDPHGIEQAALTWLERGFLVGKDGLRSPTTRRGNGHLRPWEDGLQSKARQRIRADLSYRRLRETNPHGLLRHFLAALVPEECRDLISDPWVRTLALACVLCLSLPPSCAVSKSRPFDRDGAKSRIGNSRLVAMVPNWPA
jgi:hypothetical protein